MSDAAKARSAAERADFLKTAREKFPEWDANAKAHLKTLTAQHNKKPITKGLDAYLLRYLGEMQDKNKSPSKKRKPETEAAAVASDKPAAKKIDKVASEKSKDNEEDPLLENVGSSLLARAAEDDEQPREHGNKTLADICEEIRKDGGPGIREGDILMEKPGGKSDEEENVTAVKEAEQRQLRKRKAEHQEKKSKTTETESDDENKPLFAKAKPAIKKEAAKPKSAGKKQDAKPKSDNVADDDSDDDQKVGRYKRKSASQIIASFDMAVLRPAAHKMLLARDGTELKDGAPYRLLNMHLIIAAARAVFSKQDATNFKTAMKNALQDRGDQ